MSAKERPEEREARCFFQSLGYVVFRIPAVKNVRRADYPVRSELERFIVEVKTRGPLSLTSIGFPTSRERSRCCPGVRTSTSIRSPRRPTNSACLGSSFNFRVQAL